MKFATRAGYEYTCAACGARARPTADGQRMPPACPTCGAVWSIVNGCPQGVTHQWCIERRCLACGAEDQRRGDRAPVPACPACGVPWATAVAWHVTDRSVGARANSG